MFKKLLIFFLFNVWISNKNYTNFDKIEKGMLQNAIFLNEIS